NRIRPFGGLVCLVLAAFVLNLLTLNLSAQRLSRTDNPSPTPTPGATPTSAAVATPSPSPTPSPTPEPGGQAAYAGLRFRSIGPSVTSGRVIAFAVDPNDRKK